jgi:hypothetical protein
MEYKTPILEVLLSPTEIIKLILTTCLHVGMYGILIWQTIGYSNFRTTRILVSFTINIFSWFQQL